MSRKCFNVNKKGKRWFSFYLFETETVDVLQNTTTVPLFFDANLHQSLILPFGVQDSPDVHGFFANYEEVDVVVNGQHPIPA